MSGKLAEKIDAPLLQVRDLRVTLGESRILHGVSFDVARGGITGLLGRNGAGKTTTLRGILGLAARSGSVTFAGEELTGRSVHDVVRSGIGYVPEDRDVFATLTVAENLRLAERAGSPLRYELVYELFPEVRERAHQKAGTLSGGQQQMVALARAFLNAHNRLLLVDEPTKGLAPQIVARVVRALRRAAQESTILLVEQNVAVARALVQDVVVLDQGCVEFRGDIAQLLGDASLARRYLGLGDASAKR